MHAWFCMVSTYGSKSLKIEHVARFITQDKHPLVTEGGRKKEECNSKGARTMGVAASVVSLIFNNFCFFFLSRAIGISLRMPQLQGHNQGGIERGKPSRCPPLIWYCRWPLRQKYLAMPLHSRVSTKCLLKKMSLEWTVGAHSSNFGNVVNVYRNKHWLRA